MSGTLTVKELINELLEFDMSEPVFIALGDDVVLPKGSSFLLKLSQHDSGISCGYGVYIHPSKNLIEDAE